MHIIYSVNWIEDMKSVFFYRKLSVDYESSAIDPKIWIVYDAAKGER